MLFNPWPEVLREARQEQGLSQENCAARAEVSNITWYRWESGRVYPGPKILANLASGVGLAPVALAMRYSRALLAHYQELWDELEACGDLTTAERAAANPPAAAPGDNRRPPEPILVPGISPGQGLVYVEVNELLGHLREQRDAGTAAERPGKPGSRSKPPPFRREDS